MNTINLLKRILLLIAFHGFIFGLSSCNDKRSPQTHYQKINVPEKISEIKNNDEDFDKFINDFFKKKDFQINRIIFPISNLIYDTDSEKFDSTHIKKTDWKYCNIYKQRKVVLETTKNNNGESILNAQVKETGISVNYIFNVKEGKWYLVKVIDEST